MVKYATTLVVLITMYIQDECVLATVSPDMMPTAKKKADLTECRRRVGPTLSTCQRTWGIVTVVTKVDIYSRDF